jgi:hypothetical protein
LIDIVGTERIQAGYAAQYTLSLIEVLASLIATVETFLFAVFNPGIQGPG